MKTKFAPALLAAALTLAVFTAGAQSPEAAELKQLEGTWVGGVKNPKGEFAGKAKAGKSNQFGGDANFLVKITELVIKDGKITGKGDRGRDFGEGTFTVNLKANPKTIDAVGTGGKNKGKTFLGIYKLNGDTLEWCTGNPGIERPKDYFTTPQVQFHLVLTRKKS